MAIVDRKISAFTKLISALADKPNSTQGYDSTTLKAYFDSSPEELRTALNGLIDDLITDYATKSELINAFAGSIPDFGIYPEKMAKLNTYCTNADANGIYTVVSLKRTDATLAAKSTLSNPDTLGNYQTQTVLIYAENGTTVKYTLTYTITYDINSKIVSKVVA